MSGSFFKVMVAKRLAGSCRRGGYEGPESACDSTQYGGCKGRSDGNSEEPEELGATMERDDKEGRVGADSKTETGVSQEVSAIH